VFFLTIVFPVYLMKRAVAQLVAQLLGVPITICLPL
jgi:hypothetical protein